MNKRVLSIFLIIAVIGSHFMLTGFSAIGAEENVSSEEYLSEEFLNEEISETDTDSDFDEETEFADGEDLLEIPEENISVECDDEVLEAADDQSFLLDYFAEGNIDDSEQDLDALGLVEDVTDSEEEELNGIDPIEDLLFAADVTPIAIKPELETNSIAAGTTTVLYTLTAKSTGTFHFVGTGIDEFSVFENEISRISSDTTDINSNTILTAVNMQKGQEYIIGVSTEGNSASSFYWYKLPAFCVKIPNNKFSDEDGLNALSKVFTYNGSGGKESFSTNVLVGFNKNDKYYFLTDNERIDNKNGTYSVKVVDLFSRKTLGHCWNPSKVTVEATCIKTGLMDCTCLCGETSSSQVIPKKSHTWGDWKKKSAATIFSQEIQERMCINCGAKETRKAGSKLASHITVTASKILLKKGQATTAFQVGMDSGDYIKKCSVKNSKIVKVWWDETGISKIKGVKVGKTTMTIELGSGIKTNVKINVKKTAIKTSSIKVTNPEVVNKKITLQKGEGIKLQIARKPFTTKDKISYTSKNKKIAKVTKVGFITARKKGKTTITVNSGKKTYKLTVIVK